MPTPIGKQLKAAIPTKKSHAPALMMPKPTAIIAAKKASHLICWRSTRLPPSPGLFFYPMAPLEEAPTLFLCRHTKTSNTLRGMLLFYHQPLPHWTGPVGALRMVTSCVASGLCRELDLL